MSLSLRWLRENLFSSWVSTAFTLLLIYLLWNGLPPIIDWAFLDAVWRPDAKACREAEGACWGFIAEKHRFILFGTYPYEQHWRPGLASMILIGLWVFSAIRLFWKWWLLLVWIFGLAVIGGLMWGGVFGLPYVENERWGGLILTLLLSTFGVAFAFPLSILLALGAAFKVTAVALGVLAAVFGLWGGDVGQHIRFGFFSAMVLILAHSMMMFYLIGKGKAVKDAMAEGGLTGDFYRRIAVARTRCISTPGK